MKSAEFFTLSFFFNLIEHVRAPAIKKMPTQWMLAIHVHTINLRTFKRIIELRNCKNERIGSGCFLFVLKYESEIMKSDGIKTIYFSHYFFS